MNIENAKILVGQLKRLPDEKFYMGDWVSHEKCGTVACIAGWCSILNGGPTGEIEAFEISNFAANFLGLSRPKADDLFFRSRWSTPEMGQEDRPGAIAELERMIAEAETAA